MLALWDQALIETDANWFSCPNGHFWYWAAAPEMGEPPFSKDAEVLTMPAHAPVPRNREEAKQFVQVLEMEPDGSGIWRGEWLSEFPKYRHLTFADKIAWDAWLRRQETDQYLDALVERCDGLARRASDAKGYVTLKSHPA
jgi:hypothetical protein